MGFVAGLQQALVAAGVIIFLTCISGEVLPPSGHFLQPLIRCSGMIQCPVSLTGACTPTPGQVLVGSIYLCGLDGVGVGRG